MEYRKDCEYIKTARFDTNQGADEVYLTVLSRKGLLFSDALAETHDLYQQTLQNERLSQDSLVFCQIYVSDIENQKEILQASTLFNKLSQSAVAVIQQKPLIGGPLSFSAYHVSSGSNSLQKTVLEDAKSAWRKAVSFTGKHYQMLWHTGYCGQGAFDSYPQSAGILNELVASVKGNGMALLDNMVRTWIYVRDIDNHYAGLVKARKELFFHEGLTDKTRYIASTGIEGRSKEKGSLVSINALSFSNLKPAQVVRMEALTHMSPTIDYGVTFERGLRIRFGDRSLLFVSGTASINNKGEILFPGDVEAQTRRTLENIQVLLKEQGARLNDLASITIYVRDPHTADNVLKIVSSILPVNLPMICVEASVCRPGWLAEIEGIAVIPDTTEFSPFI